MAEVAGTSDNCSVYYRDQALAQATYAHFLLPNEKLYILLKSIKGEYMFTNQACIISYGEAAAGKKRNINRFDYFLHKLRNVSFETAGMSITDQDCEIKFRIGTIDLSIDIKKAEIDQAVIVYRALLQLSLDQQKDEMRLDFTRASLTQSYLHFQEELKAENHMKLIDQVISRFNPVSYHEVMEYMTPK